MSIAGKKVFVTGAGGFIGSHLTERLVQEGAIVRAFVHYNADGTCGWLDQSEVRSNIEFIAGDICDRDSVRNAMRGTEIVFHLAALISVPYSYRSTASYVRTNVDGTVNVLQSACDLGLERVVHTSTSEVYGTAKYVPIDEAHPLQGQSPYAASKIGADKMAEAYYLSFNLPVVTLRPFNTYGPRQSARAIIPTVIAQCLTEQTVCLGNTHPTRDLNYVTDTVDGYLRASTNPEAVGRTINLGSGREISIGDLAQLIAKLTGHSISFKRDEQRARPEKSEVRRLLANSALAHDLLAWQPQISLEEGLKLTIEWIQQHLNRYRAGEYVV